LPRLAEIRLVGGCGDNDRDVELVEGPAELVYLGRLEVELVEGENERFCANAAGSLESLEKVASVPVREDVCNRRVFPLCVPPGSDAAMCQITGRSAIGRMAPFGSFVS
jgi:hypothetical protein